MSTRWKKSARSRVTLLDADADTSNEHAILGPGVGETPVRNTLLSSALFAHDIDVLLLAMLKTSDTGLDGHDPLLQRHVLVHPRAFPVLSSTGKAGTSITWKSSWRSARKNPSAWLEHSVAG